MQPDFVNLVQIGYVVKDGLRLDTCNDRGNSAD
jgi:hypothetical protein